MHIMIMSRIQKYKQMFDQRWTKYQHIVMFKVDYINPEPGLLFPGISWATGFFMY